MKQQDVRAQDPAKALVDTGKLIQAIVGDLEKHGAAGGPVEGAWFSGTLGEVTRVADAMRMALDDQRARFQVRTTEQADEVRRVLEGERHRLEGEGEVHLGILERPDAFVVTGLVETRRDRVRLPMVTVRLFPTDEQLPGVDIRAVTGIDGRFVLTVDREEHPQLFAEEGESPLTVRVEVLDDDGEPAGAVQEVAVTAGEVRAVEARVVDHGAFSKSLETLRDLEPRLERHLEGLRTHLRELEIDAAARGIRLGPLNVEEGRESLEGEGRGAARRWIERLWGPSAGKRREVEPDLAWTHEVTGRPVSLYRGSGRVGERPDVEIAPGAKVRVLSETVTVGGKELVLIRTDRGESGYVERGRLGEIKR